MKNVRCPKCKADENSDDMVVISDCYETTYVCYNCRITYDQHEMEDVPEPEMTQDEWQKYKEDLRNLLKL